MKYEPFLQTRPREAAQEKANFEAELHRDEQAEMKAEARIREES